MVVSTRCIGSLYSVCKLRIFVGYLSAVLPVAARLLIQ